MAAKSIFGRRSVSLVFCSKENTPLTTTKIIAESLDKRHTDVLELTKRYVEDLRQFGPLPFKTEMVNRVQGYINPLYIYIYSPTACQQKIHQTKFTMQNF